MTCTHTEHTHVLDAVPFLLFRAPIVHHLYPVNLFFNHSPTVPSTVPSLLALLVLLASSLPVLHGVCAIANHGALLLGSGSLAITQICKQVSPCDPGEHPWYSLRRSLTTSTLVCLLMQ